MENKFWSFIGVALAVMAFFHKQIDVPLLIFIGICTVIACFGLSYLWSKILNSHRKWIDRLFFLFVNNKQSYTVIDKIVRYSIKSSTQAEYNLQCDIKINKSPQDFCYKGRYHWDQDETIDVSVSCEGSHTYELSEDLKWSNVDIFPTDRIMHRNERLKCGFSLNNLHIHKLNKHSYLSCKMVERVKHLKLIAEVAPDLKPKDTAIFIVQNSFGEEMSRAEVQYNPSTHSYEKTVSYPRRGRKYIIKWDYCK